MPELSISSSDESSDDGQTQTQTQDVPPTLLPPMTSTPQSVSKANPRVRALKGLDPNSMTKTTPRIAKSSPKSTPKTTKKTPKTTTKTTSKTNPRQISSPMNGCK